MTDPIIDAHRRLLDALADDMLAAEAGEILSSHPGPEARVVADAMRQAIRRRLAEPPPSRPADRDLLRSLTMRPTAQEKKP